MNRCKFCGEVLEGSVAFCSNCGKSTSKTPSKRFLKKQEKEKNFKVNNDARLYRVSYKIFGFLFLLAGLVATVFYLPYFLELAFSEKVVTKYMEIINKAGGILDKVYEWLPFTEIGELNLVFIVSAVALVLSIFSLFTKKFSGGALLYKLSAIFGLIFFMIVSMVSGIVPFTVPESFLELIVENEKIITIVGASLAGGFFLLGIIFSFKFKNPYRPTFYQVHKALYWLLFAIVELLFVLELDLSFDLEKCLSYILTLMPVYILISSILLFIGAKYRGNIERLK